MMSSPSSEHDRYLCVTLQGDNHPTDVIDISSRTLQQGVYRGKILGAYALIDDGELDWRARSFGPLRLTHLAHRTLCSPAWTFEMFYLPPGKLLGAHAPPGQCCTALSDDGVPQVELSVGALSAALRAHAATAAMTTSTAAVLCTCPPALARGT